MSPRASSSNPAKGELLAKHAHGRFKDDVQAAHSADPGLVFSIASRIPERHFPESLHQHILNAVGLTLETTLTRRKRAPAFRQRVLKAYEYRCAVCGFDVRLGSVSIAWDRSATLSTPAGGPSRNSSTGMAARSSTVRRGIEGRPYHRQFSAADLNVTPFFSLIAATPAVVILGGRGIPRFTLMPAPPLVPAAPASAGTALVVYFLASALLGISEVAGSGSVPVQTSSLGATGW